MNKKAAIAARMADIHPFHVMDLLAKAKALEGQGLDVIHMEIGEPDFSTPPSVIQAGINALNSGLTHYTPAMGLWELRQAISNHYRQQFNVDVPAERIVVTPGASGALLLALGVTVNPGEKVLMADPGYPCNRHFVRFIEGQAASVAVGGDTAYQLTADLLESNWDDDTVAAMVATPANPTGTLIAPAELEVMARTVEAHQGVFLVDEIYQGLVYGQEASTVLSVSDQAFVINSFSKYFCMTGWRLGWLVVPEAYVDAVNRLEQNIFLAASTPAQYAALAAFEEPAQTVYQDRRLQFQQRRDFLLPALRELGFGISVEPQGAFYIYADCSAFTDDSYQFSLDLLTQKQVAITPGIDFGHNKPRQHVRFAYTTSMEKLERAVERLQDFL